MPCPLVLILSGLCGCSEQSDSAEMVQCQFSGPGPWKLAASTLLEGECLGYSLLKHSCYAGRRLGHVERPHIGALVISPR